MQGTQLVSEEPVRSSDERTASRADSGFRVDALADSDRLLEQGIEDSADGLMSLAEGQRAPDLSENLAFSDDERFQPGGNRECVGDRTLVEEDRTQ